MALIQMAFRRLCSLIHSQPMYTLPVRTPIQALLRLRPPNGQWQPLLGKIIPRLARLESTATERILRWSCSTVSLEVFVAAQMELTLRFISSRVRLCLIRRNPFGIIASENLVTSPNRSTSSIESGDVVCQSICSPRLMPYCGDRGLRIQTPLICQE